MQTKLHQIAEKWSPIEVAVFEAAMTLYGKNFHTVQKYVRFLSLIIFNFLHFHFFFIPFSSLLHR